MKELGRAAIKRMDEDRANEPERGSAPKPEPTVPVTPIREKEEDCPDCGGHGDRFRQWDGAVLEDDCPTCFGSGKRKGEKA